MKQDPDLNHFGTSKMATGWIIFGVIAIIVIIIVVIVSIYFITQIGAIVSTPFVPQGTVVRLRNMQSGQYLGICSIGLAINCTQGTIPAGDYAATPGNDTDPTAMQWTVNIDPDNQFVALQNVKTGRYMSNITNTCNVSGLLGNIVSVQLGAIVNSNDDTNGWFASQVPAANSVQLGITNPGSGALTYLGTQPSNVFPNSCSQMISDGFGQAEINQITFAVEIV